MSEALFLDEVQTKPPTGHFGEAIRRIRSAGGTVPHILHLFAFKPEQNHHLSRFTHVVMRGSSPLSPGLRELIAAFTSARNHCVF